MLLWGGLAGVMGVWAVCFRLTFWELSWDVMEPITYFIGSGTGTESKFLASLTGQLQQLFADLTCGAEVCCLPACFKQCLMCQAIFVCMKLTLALGWRGRLTDHCKAALCLQALPSICTF